MTTEEKNVDPNAPVEVEPVEAKYTVRYNELVGAERVGAPAFKYFNSKKKAEDFAEEVGGRLV